MQRRHGGFVRRSKADFTHASTYSINFRCVVEACALRPYRIGFMAFDDTFRLSSHAVILNADSKVLMLKASYGAFSWGLPGGALEPGETIHDALHRECFEEMGVRLSEACLTGVYFHKT